MTYACPRCDAPQNTPGNCRRCLPRLYISVRPVPDVKPVHLSPAWNQCEGMWVKAGRWHVCRGTFDAAGAYSHAAWCPYDPNAPRAEIIVSMATRPAKRERFNCLARAFALAAMEWGKKGVAA